MYLLCLTPYLTLRIGIFFGKITFYDNLKKKVSFWQIFDIQLAIYRRVCSLLPRVKELLQYSDDLTELRKAPAVEALTLATKEQLAM